MKQFIRLMNFVRKQIKRLLDLRHWRHLNTLVANRGEDYRDYLKTQLNRSLPRRKRVTTKHFLIDALFDLALISPQSKVLCIGSRNNSEIDYFRSKGVSDVIGIDLFSESPDILVMDMHRMTFQDDAFDIVYASHSLEHSYEPETVIREIVRVARPGAALAVEVPVRYQTHEADRVDFGGLMGLKEIFAPYVADMKWGEEQAPNLLRNPHGIPIARAVFITKE